MYSYWGFPLQSENRPPEEAPAEGSVMVLTDSSLEHQTSHGADRTGDFL